uniref:Uncharacterized protein n=1 Tax=Arundo donax TaxID=35708 RepID=A0A0A9C6S4_ARUDO
MFDHHGEPILKKYYSNLRSKAVQKELNT